MVVQLPRASFGKPPGASAYQIISQHAAFESPAAARAFRRIYSSFEWKPTTGETLHPPCLAILPVENFILLARYSDDGRDSIGRPHTLKVDCFLTSPKNFAEAWQTLAPDMATPPIPSPDTLEIIGDQATHTAQI